ncbi:ATP-dependent zinc metalloprotease FtsH [Patescibacteria group bacterium]|nr:ATP-dependent zinc metalloprotease FtsH [Patescibacteria group bacterium]
MPVKKKTVNNIKKKQIKFKFQLRDLVVWVFIFLLVGSFFIPKPDGKLEPEETITLSQAIADIKAEKVNKIQVVDDEINIEYKDEKLVSARKETDISFSELLVQEGVSLEKLDLEVKDLSAAKVWAEVLSTVLPLVLMGAFFFFIYKQAKGAQDSVFSFSKSKAKLFAKGKQDITFKDVAGVDEAKKELEEVVDFLKHSQKYKKFGARTPKGVLLVGPSGTGKTLLAKAIAGEAKVPFFSMAGSEFMEMLVGVGANRVRDLFSTAKKASPSIIFIDEIDAIGRQRGVGFAGGHDEREQTLNQILVEMDGFTPNDNVIVMAATNRGDLLDSALLRSGRFDRRITLDFPDIEDREEIIKIHAKGKPFARSVSWEKISRRTVGFSGADLENMLNEAAIAAAGSEREAINMEDIEEAAMKVQMGSEKKRLQSKEERKMTAYHEAGHAVVSFFLPKIDPVHRVSIVSRGIALGFTMTTPKKDHYNETKSHLLETIVSLLGGRAAEEMIFSELTGGAASDIDRATRIARAMVTDYGMSDLGPIYLGPQIEQMGFGRSSFAQSEISPEMMAKVDREIKKIVDEAYRQAKNVLKKNKKKLDLIAKNLIEKETLDGEDFEKLMSS